MSRPPAPIPPDAPPSLVDLATSLRSLRLAAGLTLRELECIVHYSPTALSRAASGKMLPTWDITRAYIAGCGENPEHWRPLWEAAVAAVAAESPKAASVAAAPVAGESPTAATQANPTVLATGIPSLKLMSLAVLIAGRGRAPSLSAEWRSHLAGEAGRGLTRRQQMNAACGFVRASACCRAQDAADLWWRAGDKILASRRWSNAVVWLPTLFAVFLVIARDGVYGVVANFENLASLCGSLFLAIRLGQKWRGVKPQCRLACF